MIGAAGLGLLAGHGGQAIKHGGEIAAGFARRHKAAADGIEILGMLEHGRGERLALLDGFAQVREHISATRYLSIASAVNAIASVSGVPEEVSK